MNEAKEKIRVLFICVHNSARSQIAEALLNRLAGDRFEAESAGLEPGQLHPLAVEAMREMGVDISMKQTKGVFDLHGQGRSYGYVIAVCDEASQTCPIFPGLPTNLHWSFDDPSAFTGTDEEKLAKMRRVRDEIRRKIEEFIKERNGGKR